MKKLVVPTSSGHTWKVPRFTTRCTTCWQTLSPMSVSSPTYSFRFAFLVVCAIDVDEPGGVDKSTDGASRVDNGVDSETRSPPVPLAVRTKVLAALSKGITFDAGQRIQWQDSSYSIQDVLAAIHPTFSANASPPLHSGAGGDRGLTAVQNPAGKRVHAKNGRGKNGSNPSRKVVAASTRGKAEDRQREHEQLSSTSDVRKTKNCFPRLVNILIQDNYRHRFQRTQLQPSRGALDAGATGARQQVWMDIREAYVDPNFKVRDKFQMWYGGNHARKRTVCTPVTQDPLLRMPLVSSYAEASVEYSWTMRCDLS